DDLGTLRLGSTIGDQRQAHAQLFEAIERLVSAGKHAQFGFVELVEAIGDRVANLAWRNRAAGGAREPRKSLRYDVAPRRADTGAPVLVPRRVGPQVPRVGLDRGDDIIGRLRCQVLDKSGNDPTPLAHGLAKGRKDRVVE